MGRRSIDYTNCQIDRLFVVEQIPYENDNYVTMWKCECSCGNTCVRSNEYLATKKIKVKSCGCYAKDVHIKHAKELDHTKHNGYGTKLYGVWNSMKQRCYNPNVKSYNRYGGRGIKVCKSWYMDFSVFRKWALENGYKDGLTIDRIDNDRGYAPWNCRWVTKKIQAQNRHISRRKDGRYEKSKY